MWEGEGGKRGSQEGLQGEDTFRQEWSWGSLVTVGWEVRRVVTQMNWPTKKPLFYMGGRQL